MSRRRLVVIAVVLCLSVATAVLAATLRISVYVDGQQVPADALLRNGRVYLPVRAVGAALGYDVHWDSYTKAVYVTRAPASQTQSTLCDSTAAPPPTPSQSASATGAPAATLSKHDWSPMVQGTGAMVVENSPHLLEVALAPSAADHPEAKSFRAGAAGRTVLKGDFDIQVDFHLLDWPEGNGVRVGLLTTLGDVERTSHGTDDFADTPGEIYATNFLDEVTLTATQDRRGTLRLVRQGDRITGYALQSGEWKALGSAVVPLRDCMVPRGCVVFSLFVWSHNDVFTHQAVRVAFDHFLINSGTLVPNPGPLLAPHSGPGVRPVTEQGGAAAEAGLQ